MAESLSEVSVKTFEADTVDSIGMASLRERGSRLLLAKIWFRQAG